jgi:hypothetical protein
MSFFDEVETTVANSCLVQAAETKQKVVLPLQDFAELSALDETIQKSLTISNCFEPDTIPRYQFLLWLQSVEQTDPTIQKQSYLFQQLEHFRRVVDAHSSVAVYSSLVSYFSLNLPPLPMEPVLNPDLDSKTPSTRSESLLSSATLIDEKQLATPSSHPGQENLLLIRATSLDSKAVNLEPVISGEISSNESPTHVLPAVVETKEGTPASILTKLYQDYSNNNLFTNFFSPIHPFLEESFAPLLPSFIRSDQYKRLVQARAYCKKPVSPNDFQVFRVLGKGAFGSVYFYFLFILSVHYIIFII